MKLDLNVWTTQQTLANELDVTRQVVNNWIRRGKIKTFQIPNSSLILVNRKTAPTKKDV